jgi:DNA-binding MarR family transcriptional regulator
VFLLRALKDSTYPLNKTQIQELLYPGVHGPTPSLNTGKLIAELVYKKLITKIKSQACWGQENFLYGLAGKTYTADQIQVAVGHRHSQRTQLLITQKLAKQNKFEASAIIILETIKYILSQKELLKSVTIMEITSLIEQREYTGFDRFKIDAILASLVETGEITKCRGSDNKTKLYSLATVTPRDRLTALKQANND